jgi:hypothetical protein
MIAVNAFSLLSGIWKRLSNSWSSAFKDIGDNWGCIKI